MVEEYERETPLFDEQVPILLQLADREERSADLRLRVLNGHRQAARGTKERLLHIEITDEDDSLFLFTLDVSEEEFHELKNDQKLLVDFSAFASKFIELLLLCVEEKSSGDPPECNASSISVASAGIGSSHRFLAVLNNRNTSGHAIFSIVEANLFKQLTHLSLKFRPGNDLTVKKYLADRLGQIKHQNQKLSQQLSRSERELRLAKEEAKTAVETAREMTDQRELEMKQLKLDYNAKLNEQKEKALQASEQMQERHQQELRELRQKSEKTIAELREALSSYEQQNKGLTEGKLSSQNKESQLRNRLDEVNRAYERCKADLDMARAQLSEGERERFELEKKLNQQKLEMATLQQKVRDKEEMIDKMTSIVQTAESHKLNFDESLKLYKENYAKLQEKLEASIQEINKGNEIIQKYQADHRTLKSKLKTRSLVIKQQEQAIQEREKEIRTITKQMTALESQSKEKEDEAERLKADLQSANSKLAEGNKLLQSNQQVIAWLNKEINELQLNRSRTKPSSTAYTFKPSVSPLDLKPSSSPTASWNFYLRVPLASLDRSF